MDLNVTFTMVDGESWTEGPFEGWSPLDLAEQIDEYLEWLVTVNPTQHESLAHVVVTDSADGGKVLGRDINGTSLAETVDEFAVSVPVFHNDPFEVYFGGEYDNGLY